ncbi:MAG: hypothetical protein ACX939_05080 [Hyphococcus sp.]
MIASVVMPFIVIAFGALLVTAALAPIETLSWWAGWTEEELDAAHSKDAVKPVEKEPSAKLFVVYLSGIASISGRFLIPRERAFVRGLREHLPDAVVIDSVFPYSPAGAGLTAATRFFDRLWRRIQKLKLQGRGQMLSALINFRNVFQVMISADHRYGPIYNRGAAEVIEKALLDAGYPADSQATIVIIGYSGGAQIAVGAATYLKARLKAPIDIISIGGVMASDPGLDVVRRLDHLYGEHDHIQKLGGVIFPERWKAMSHSEWNAATRDGRLRRRVLTGMIHAGPQGYFGLPKTAGVSNSQRTLEQVLDILSTTHS